MKPLDPDAESLLREWVEKADADLDVARMASAAADNLRIREIAGFHCRQAVEKYLKALLTYCQIEFPKTHQIHRLLSLLSGVNREGAESLTGASWLGHSASKSAIPATPLRCCPAINTELISDSAMPRGSAPD